MIKIREERMFEGPIDIGEPLSLAVLCNAIIERSRRDGVNLVVREDQASLGLLSGTNPCVVVCNAQHMRDYYSYVVVQRISGNRAFLFMYLGGESKNYRNQVISETSTGMLSKALFGPNKAKHQQEHMYYEHVKDIISEGLAVAISMRGQAPGPGYNNQMNPQQGYNNNQIDPEFVNVVKEADNGRDWAKQELNRLWNQNDPEFFHRVNDARLQIYGEAARQGDPKARYWVGRSLSFINKQESLRLLMQLADEGNVDAMKAIALGYSAFGGYGENEKESFEWNLRAAKAGDAEAQASTGLEYRIKGRLDEASYWYDMSAKQGNVDGILGMAYYYNQKKFELHRDGQSLEVLRQLDAQEESYYIRALNNAVKETQFEEACRGIAHLYNSSMFTAPDPKRAAYYYGKSYLCGNKHSLESFQRLVNEYGFTIYMDQIDEWARANGII